MENYTKIIRKALNYNLVLQEAINYSLCWHQVSVAYMVTRSRLKSQIICLVFIQNVCDKQKKRIYVVFRIISDSGSTQYPSKVNLKSKLIFFNLLVHVPGRIKHSPSYHGPSQCLSSSPHFFTLLCLFFLAPVLLLSSLFLDPFC